MTTRRTIPKPAKAPARKYARSFAILLVLIMALAPLACGLFTPTDATPQVEVNTSAEPSLEPSAETNLDPTGQPSAETATVTPTAIPVSSPKPTTAPLELEIVQSQVWADRYGDVRVNVLLRNPYDFPVEPGFGARASVLNSMGELIRAKELYFLDGISGGNGFILPGEKIAANACFTCEAAPLTEEWASVEFEISIVDATGSWNYSTEVEASVEDFSFDGDSPIFWITGSVKNSSDSALGRISVRVFVFDQEDNLVGAAEASAWEVGPGAAANISGYGIGEAPDGPIEYEVTSLGVTY